MQGVEPWSLLHKSSALTVELHSRILLIINYPYIIYFYYIILLYLDFYYYIIIIIRLLLYLDYYYYIIIIIILLLLYYIIILKPRGCRRARISLQQQRKLPSS